MNFKESAQDEYKKNQLCGKTIVPFMILYTCLLYLGSMAGRKYSPSKSYGVKQRGVGHSRADCKSVVDARFSPLIATSSFWSLMRIAAAAAASVYMPTPTIGQAFF